MTMAVIACAGTSFQESTSFRVCRRPLVQRSTKLAIHGRQEPCLPSLSFLLTILHHYPRYFLIQKQQSSTAFCGHSEHIEETASRVQICLHFIIQDNVAIAVVLYFVIGEDVIAIFAKPFHRGWMSSWWAAVERTTANPGGLLFPANSSIC